MSEPYRIKTYEIWSRKIPMGSDFTMAVIADLHSREYGPENEYLLSQLRDISPDALFMAGDMMLRTEPHSLRKAAFFLKNAAALCPVYYAYGNHESRLKYSSVYSDAFLHYEEYLKRHHVHILSNSHQSFTVKGIPFAVYGLELPLRFYKRFRSHALTVAAMERVLGRPDENSYTVLIAHNPAYGKTYFGWKADLILSGHYHGGILRFDENHGLVSPRILPPFPAFCCGRFSRDGQNMLVSAGMGEHTIPVRIHNPRELLIIKLHGGRVPVGT